MDRDAHEETLVQIREVEVAVTDFETVDANGESAWETFHCGIIECHEVFSSADVEAVDYSGAGISDEDHFRGFIEDGDAVEEDYIREIGDF